MKPSLPQGTRDFGPDVVRKRQYILNTIRSVFELYGFQPLETPAFENLDTLMGKYGEEGDKLIFKILNNGLDNPAKEQSIREAFENVLQGKNNKVITERALKYDLTIPFARYVAMNHGQLNFPFKRYQIQPVWRADRPQKGRYREFYQCDADIVGSKALINEVELVLIYRDVFKTLGIEVEIRINSRKILTALAELCGGIHLMIPITTAIDKIDKIGEAGVKKELQNLNLSESHIATILSFLTTKSTADTIQHKHYELLSTNVYGRQGLDDVFYVLKSIALDTQFKNYELVFDLSLARGLNYYTGIIFEVRAKGVQIGSIGGGGRYDDLTGLFGVPNIPGVGISFGVDRIYDVMEELNLFPATIEVGTKVLFFNLGENESKVAYTLLQELRRKGIASEIYHEAVKMDKQFKYAEKKQIPYVVIIGSKEVESGSCTVKNIVSGEQEVISQKELLALLSSK